MLHLETIEPRTVALLEKLLSLPILRDFHLVGGTALALKYGHRISIGLDLFGHKGFDKDFIVETLSNEFGEAFIPELTTRTPRRSVRHEITDQRLVAAFL